MTNKEELVTVTDAVEQTVEVVTEELATTAAEVAEVTVGEMYTMTEESLVKVLVEKGVDAETAKNTAAHIAEQKKEQTPGTVKPWFAAAVKDLTSPSKLSLISRLRMEQLKSKEESVKAEIEKEIERLKDEKSGDDRFKNLLTGYIIKEKGWKVENGKLVDFAYMLGDTADKVATGITATTGKALAWTGEKIMKGGQALETNAPKMGQLARKPFDATGRGLDKLNNKLDKKKLEKETKKIEEKVESEKKVEEKK